MRFLFLDDDRTRHRKFADMAIGHHVVHVETAEEAIKAIEDIHPFDAIFLDHDLEGTYQSSDSENCGFRVVEFILQHYKGPRIPVIVIHSMNRFGAAKMYENLVPGKVIACPFGYWKLETRNGMPLIRIDI